MTQQPPPFWPTALFRPAHVAEHASVRRLLGLVDGPGTSPMLYVLADIGPSADAVPRAAVAVEARDETWLVRAAFGVEDPHVAARIGCDLLGEAVRAGAVTVVTPAEADPACRAVLAGAGARRHGQWLIAEL